MERAHYRKVKPAGGVFGVAAEQSAYRSPRASAPEKDNSGKTAERIVMQFIISGVILAIALFINLIDTPITNKAAAVVKMAIQTQTSTDQLKQAAGAAQNTVKTIFGKDKSQELASNDESIEAQEDVQEEAPAAGLAEDGVKAEENGIPEESSDRIDEDILRLILSQENY
jgi:uncharacterized protein YpmB